MRGASVDAIRTISIYDANFIALDLAGVHDFSGRLISICHRIGCSIRDYGLNDRARSSHLSWSFDTSYQTRSQCESPNAQYPNQYQSGGQGELPQILQRNIDRFPGLLTYSFAGDRNAQMLLERPGKFIQSLAVVSSQVHALVVGKPQWNGIIFVPADQYGKYALLVLLRKTISRRTHSELLESGDRSTMILPRLRIARSISRSQAACRTDSRCPPTGCRPEPDAAV
jgi:hypothetical protein